MILETFWLLKDAKTLLFCFPQKGGISPPIDRIDQIDQTASEETLWSIYKQIWSSFHVYIDHSISFPICDLQALVNLVKFSRYTPPLARKSRDFVVNLAFFSRKNLTTRLTTNEESTTYRGCFSPLFSKPPKSFKRNTALQPKDLSQFGQSSTLETFSAERRPIMPIDYKLYPPEWHSISRRIRFERAKNHCEWCDAQNYQPHPVTGSIVILTVAHLGIDKPDGSPGSKEDLYDVREGNLAALCQRCHLNFDRDDHLRRRFANRRAARLARGEQLLPFGDGLNETIQR